MGYIRHHTIVVTGADDFGGHVTAAHEEARRVFTDTAAHVSEITPASVNASKSFFIAPDGSKEWWDESDRCNAAREQYVAWLREQGHVEWVEVQFGDDEHQTLIVNDSDHFPGEDDE
jgi:hypothetical protein